MAHVVENSVVDQKSDASITCQDFVSLISQQSISAAIGTDLLNISEFDTNNMICEKIQKSCALHPDHLLEIMLSGLISIVFNSETKDEILESCIFAISIADRTLSH